MSTQQIIQSWEKGIEPYNSKVRNPDATQPKHAKRQATKEVIRALRHVRQYFPNVCKVTYGEDTRWIFTDAKGNAPAFNDKIDVGILEDAQNSLCDFPVTFRLSPKTGQASTDVKQPKINFPSLLVSEENKRMRTQKPFRR